LQESAPTRALHLVAVDRAAVAVVVAVAESFAQTDGHHLHRKLRSVEQNGDSEMRLLLLQSSVLHSQMAPQDRMRDGGGLRVAAVAVGHCADRYCCGMF